MNIQVLSTTGSTTTNYDELDAMNDDVLVPYSFIGLLQQKSNGKMINNGSIARVLSAGDSMFISKGYHSGMGTITALSLEDQTPGSITPERMSIGKTAWVDGKKITGIAADNTYNGSNPADVVGLTDMDDKFLYILFKNGLYKNYSNSVSIDFKSIPDITITSLGGKKAVDLNFIKSGENVFGNRTGTYTDDATVIASKVRIGKTIYSKGQKIVGTMSVPTLY